MCTVASARPARYARETLLTGEGGLWLAVALRIPTATRGEAPLPEARDFEGGRLVVRAVEVVDILELPGEARVGVVVICEGWEDVLVRAERILPEECCVAVGAVLLKVVRHEVIGAGDHVHRLLKSGEREERGRGG